MKIRKRNLAYIVGGALIALLVPFIAMQVSDSVQWTLYDFIIAFIFLLLVGLMYELVISRVRNKTTRYSIAIVVALLFVFVWAELAVGIFH